MAEREKVIRGLEACARDVGIMHCRECPYNGILCITPLLRDALALLKDQEARVMTLEELCSSPPDYMYLETYNGWLECVIQDIGESSASYGTFVYGFDMSFVKSWKSYGKDWRCWTDRPTYEQMKEAPWQD